MQVHTNCATGAHILDLDTEKMTTQERLRNVGISAHVDSGKTTLTERMLFYAGRIHKIREVRGGDGGATTDSDPIERRRGITIKSAVTHVDWKKHHINVIDTPGHVDFTVEVERSLRVLDGAVLVLCSVGGVQSQSLTVDRQMRRYGVPRIALVNKMDRTGANPERVVHQLRSKLTTNAVPLQLPVGKESQFKGVVDLVSMQCVYFKGEHGEKVVRTAIPQSLIEDARAAQRVMMESLSMLDDRILEMLLEGINPGDEELRRVIRQATIAQQMTPVLFASAYKNKGVQEVLDAITMYLPNPSEREVMANEIDSEVTQRLTSSSDEPLVALAFKTVVESFGQLTFMRIYQGKIEKGSSYANARTGRSVRFRRMVRIHADQREDIDHAEAGDIVGILGVDCASGDTFLGEGANVSLENIHVPTPVMQLAIAPVDRNDADRFAKALDRFRREDPTFQVSTHPETGETLISGMGRLHLDVYLERLRDDHECVCDVGPPSVTYQERPSQSVRFEHTFKKQTGGPGQYAKVVGSMEPIPFGDEEASFEFVDEVRGGNIPREYISSIEQGFAEALKKGALAGYPVVGLRITLQDGDSHEKDSSDSAFLLCAGEAMREAILPKAGLALYEPVMKVEVEIPGDYQGAVAGHFAKHRGVVTASEQIDDNCVIEAEAPLTELFDFANEFRSITQGQGSFTMEFLAYRQAPAHVQEHVVLKRRAVCVSSR